MIKGILRECQRSKDMGKRLQDMSIQEVTAVEIKLYAGKNIKAAGGTGIVEETGKIIENDKLGFHCDQVYDVNGKVEVKKNSQEPWTPVVTASFSSTRTLTFRYLPNIYPLVLLTFPNIASLTSKRVFFKEKKSKGKKSK